MRMEPVGPGVGHREPVLELPRWLDRHLGQVVHTVHVVAQRNAVPVQRVPRRPIIHERCLDQIADRRSDPAGAGAITERPGRHIAAADVHRDGRRPDRGDDRRRARPASKRVTTFDRRVGRIHQRTTRSRPGRRPGATRGEDQCAATCDQHFPSRQHSHLGSLLRPRRRLPGSTRDTMPGWCGGAVETEWRGSAVPSTSARGAGIVRTVSGRTTHGGASCTTATGTTEWATPTGGGSR